jgi:hypothetical protein
MTRLDLERMEAAEPPRQPVRFAVPSRRRPAAGKPYVAELDPDVADELCLAIGRGLGALGVDEDAPPAKIVEAIALAVDDAELALHPDAALALACTLGQQIARELGWEFAHLRRTRAPGIVVVSPDRRWAVGPRVVVEAGGDAIRALWNRLLHGELPASKPGRFVRLR